MKLLSAVMLFTGEVFALLYAFRISLVFKVKAQTHHLRPQFVVQHVIVCWVANVYFSLSLSLLFLVAASSLVLGITVLIRTYLLDGLISLSVFHVFDQMCVADVMMTVDLRGEMITIFFLLDVHVFFSGIFPVFLHFLSDV